jgi:hypothetical protein
MPVARTIRDDGAAEFFRYNVVLIGTYNRYNREFILPEPVIHDPPNGIQVIAYHGGRRLNPWEYEITSTILGSGILDLLRLTLWSPGPNNKIVVDYKRA